MPSLTARLPPMRYRHILLALALLPIASAANAIEPSDLKPGLIAVHADGAVKDGWTPVASTNLDRTATLLG